MCVSWTWLVRGLESSPVWLPYTCMHSTPPDPLHTHPVHELTPARLPLHPPPAHETSGLGPAGPPSSLLILAFPQRPGSLRASPVSQPPLLSPRFPAPPGSCGPPQSLTPTQLGATGAEDTGGAAIPPPPPGSLRRAPVSHGQMQGQEGVCAREGDGREHGAPGRNGEKREPAEQVHSQASPRGSAAGGQGGPDSMGTGNRAE